MTRCGATHEPETTSPTDRLCRTVAGLESAAVAVADDVTADRVAARSYMLRQARTPLTASLAKRFSVTPLI